MAEYKEKVAKPPVRFSEEQLDKMRFDTQGEFKSWLGEVEPQIHSLITERVVNSIGPALDRSAASLSILATGGRPGASPRTSARR